MKRSIFLSRLALASLAAGCGASPLVVPVASPKPCPPTITPNFVVPTTKTTAHVYVGSGGVLTDLLVDGSSWGPSTYVDGSVDIQGDNITIQGVYFLNTPYFGAWVTRSSNVRILDCIFDGCGRLGGNDSVGGGFGNTNVEVARCTFVRCHGSSIDLVDTSGAWYHDNVVYDPGNMLGDFGLTNAIVERNTLHKGNIFYPDNKGNDANVVRYNRLDIGTILVPPNNQVYGNTFGC